MGCRLPRNRPAPHRLTFKRFAWAVKLRRLPGSATGGTYSENSGGFSPPNRLTATGTRFVADAAGCSFVPSIVRRRPMSVICTPGAKREALAHNKLKQTEAGQISLAFAFDARSRRRISGGIVAIGETASKLLGDGEPRDFHGPFDRKIAGKIYIAVAKNIDHGQVVLCAAIVWRDNSYRSQCFAGQAIK